MSKFSLTPEEFVVVCQEYRKKFPAVDNMIPRPRIFYVMGCTCVGKSELIVAIKERWGDEFGFVQVGKEFRKKYPPEYFKGQANPEFCHLEALKMYVESMNTCLERNVKAIIVDGQPRNNQVQFMVNQTFLGCSKYFFLLHAPAQARLERAKALFANDPESFNLAERRVIDDERSHYNMLVDLLCTDSRLKIVHTDCNKSEWIDRVLEIISRTLETNL